MEHGLETFQLPEIPPGEATLEEIGRASCRERVWLKV
jgi:hypothetical protein